MKNKKQVTVLATVLVTLDYDTKCGLDEDMIKQEVSGAVKGAIDEIWWFADRDQEERECAFIHETSVQVNEIIPSNYKYK